MLDQPISQAQWLVRDAAIASGLAVLVLVAAAAPVLLFVAVGAVAVHLAITILRMRREARSALLGLRQLSADEQQSQEGALAPVPGEPQLEHRFLASVVTSSACVAAAVTLFS